MTRVLGTITLLVFSNVFMTAAWYGHLKWFPQGKRTFLALAMVVMFSWLLALPEYCLQVPGNRLGHVSNGGPFTTPQLKILQEAITLVVFAVFSIMVLGDRFRWNDIVAFVLIFAGVAVSMLGRKPNDAHAAQAPAPTPMVTPSVP